MRAMQIIEWGKPLETREYLNPDCTRGGDCFEAVRRASAGRHCDRDSAALAETKHLMLAPYSGSGSEGRGYAVDDRRDGAYEELAIPSRQR